MSASPDLSLESRLTVPDHVLVQRFAGELTILNSETERYFSLDEIGARMWDAVAETDTLGAAHARLVETLDATPERLQEDMLSLVRDLARTGLLVVQP